MNRRRLRSLASTAIRWFRRSLGHAARTLVVAWATLALYYSNLPSAWARLILAMTFAAFAVWALWVTRRPRMGWAFAAAFGAVVLWFACIRPSHDRAWRPEVAVL